MITAVGKVVVPVDDQERALEFWTERAGFRLERDEVYGDERWIGVATPEGGPPLMLSQRRADQPRADMPEMLPHSPVFFTCRDVRQTFREASLPSLSAPPTPLGRPCYAPGRLRGRCR